MASRKGPANIINHIGLVLDASYSMTPHAANLVKVADGQIAHLAERSRELQQETRISVWVFSDKGKYECVVWDRDVLRLPSIQSFYSPNGNTAFIDAALDSIRDLQETPERYGDHSFLLFILTDGEENDSLRTPPELLKRLNSLPDHWTVAALVPNTSAKFEAKKFGFPSGNIEIWDTANLATGVSEAGSRIREATETFMQNRAQGIRSTKSLFSTDSAAVNVATVSAAGLTPLDRSTYMLVPVPRDQDIKGFVEDCGWKFRVGQGFYELSKTEDIQPQKEIMIVERGPRGNVYRGREARQLIGLPDMTVHVKPDYNADFAVFVQSTSNNRKLKAGTKFLYLR